MKKNLAFLLILVIALVAFAPLSFADGEVAVNETPAYDNWLERHNIQPVLEGHYYYGLQMGNCANITCAATQYDNTFGINRFYFGLKGDITDHIGFNFTFDSNAAIGTFNTANFLFVKYAYLVFKDYDAVPGLSFIVV